MPEIATEVRGSETFHRFDKSPIMSTYLLAWVIAELEFIEAKASNGLPIRVYATRGKAEQGRFGLDVACAVMPFYDQWFGVPYVLPKLDMIAVPDFAAGAMENFGCVTYRETALLLDAKISSTRTKTWVCQVV
jgi:aminopeptidase N